MIHIVPLPKYSSKWTINKYNFNKSIWGILDHCVKWCINSSTLKKDEINVNLHLIKTDRMRQINKKYRGFDKPTNVIAFSSDPIPEEVNAPRDLGDIFLCEEIIIKEAKEQNKDFKDHLAHMVVHGTLHLLGYDHQNETEEARMRQKEIIVLSKMGIDNPYKSNIQKAE